MHAPNIETYAKEGGCMPKHRHDMSIQIWIASGLSVVGLILLFMGLYFPPTGRIDASVLVAYGEVMTFSGALFGIDYHYRR